MKNTIRTSAFCAFFASLTGFAFAGDKEITYRVDFGGYQFNQESAPSTHAEGGLMGIGYTLSDVKGYWGDNISLSAVTSVTSDNFKTDLKLGLSSPQKMEYTRYSVGYARSIENVFVAPVSLGISYSSDILKLKESSLGAYDKIKTDVVNVDFSVFSHKLDNPYVYWSATLSVPVWKNQTYKNYDGAVSVQPTGKVVVGHVFNRNVFVEMSYQKQLINNQNSVIVGAVTYNLPKTTTETTLLSFGYVF